MIAGTIGVTLELNDKTFNVRIEKAGQSMRQLTANLADAGKTAEAFGASLPKALSANVVQTPPKLRTAQSRASADRKSVVAGQSVAVRGDLGGSCTINKRKTIRTYRR